MRVCRAAGLRWGEGAIVDADVVGFVERLTHRGPRVFGHSNYAPTTLQTQHEHAASTNRALFASVNHGTPAIAATVKPGVFTGAGVIAPKGVKATNKAALTTGSPGASKPLSATNKAALVTGSTSPPKLDTVPRTEHKTSNPPGNAFAAKSNAGKGPHPGAHGPPVHTVNQHPKGPKKPEKNG